MSSPHSELLNPIAEYYSGRLQEHGATPRGVDWNGEESQFLRFAQLAKLLPQDGFTVLDFGCGYGALLDYLAEQRYQDFHYTGLDVSPSMLGAAAEKKRQLPHPAQWCSEVNSSPAGAFDYVLASGILNVKLHFDTEQWEAYVHQTVSEFDRLSSKGFAFNCLTAYSDEDRKRSDLFYPKPELFFELCKRKYSRNVALLHDYELYEFTILVRK